LGVLSKNWNHRTLRIWIVLVLVVAVQSQAIASRHRLDMKVKRMKGIVADLKKRLGLPYEVGISVVPRNELVVSVEPVRGKDGVFRISFEESFLEVLDEDNLRAVVAHELGHVWIFTHHPYLHTEDLANRFAERLVTADALDRVYEKLRARQGVGPRVAARH
jgi:hypothetical protein